jgi:hypothetical protein
MNPIDSGISGAAVFGIFGTLAAAWILLRAIFGGESEGKHRLRLVAGLGFVLMIVVMVIDAFGFAAALGWAAGLGVAAWVYQGFKK